MHLPLRLPSCPPLQTRTKWTLNSSLWPCCIQNYKIKCAMWSKRAFGAVLHGNCCTVSTPCNTAPKVHLLPIAQLTLVKRGGSYGCIPSLITVPIAYQSVFVCPWSGEVCMMAEVEEGALLTITIVCVIKKMKVLELKNYSPMAWLRFLGWALPMTYKKIDILYMSTLLGQKVNIKLLIKLVFSFRFGPNVRSIQVLTQFSTHKRKCIF